MIHMENGSEDNEDDGHMPHLLVPGRLLLRAAELLKTQNCQGRGDEGECAALGLVLPQLFLSLLSSASSLTWTFHSSSSLS